MIVGHGAQHPHARGQAQLLDARAQGRQRLLLDAADDQQEAIAQRGGLRFQASRMRSVFLFGLSDPKCCRYGRSVGRPSAASVA